jgi:GGDEF domain-containing protein
MPEAPFGARRPHPVADVPPAALADGQAPAKGWLLALVAARPLHDAPALPMPDLARDAPALCAAVLRAVGSDADLSRLQAGGDLVGLAARAGELAGAGGPAATVAAVASMRAALWQALLETTAPLDAATTAALAERLAFVCDAVTAAALGAAGDAVAGAARGAPGDAVAGAAPGVAGDVVAGADRGAAGDAVAGFRVRDARADWGGAVDRLLGDGRPFALLAVEADDAPRLVAADAEAAAGAFARVEQAVRGELRPGDVLGRDEDGRLWIVAADLGAQGARALAERLVDAVAAVAPLRGAPLTVSIGLAASPDDGADREALAGRADESLYAARAAGVPLS